LWSGAFGGFNQETPGAAYVFTRSGTTWTQQAKLTPNPSLPGDSFGQSVALEGDTLAVGACVFWPGNVGWENMTGSVHVYTRSGSMWSLQQTLTVSDGVLGDNFGGVTLRGDTLVAGAWNADGAVADSGAVYLFTRSGGSGRSRPNWLPATARPGPPPSERPGRSLWTLRLRP
jgi:hypothetical protein